LNASSTSGPHPAVRPNERGDGLRGQRLGQEGQALVHAVVDRTVIVAEFLVAVGDRQFIQPPFEPARAVEQVELIATPQSM